jgi:hypothetical protein
VSAAAIVRVEQRGNYWQAVTIDEHGTPLFRWSPCICIDQAVASASRGASRPVRFVGAFYMTSAGLAPLTNPQTDCCVTDRQHAWTHGTAHRMAVQS